MFMLRPTLPRNFAEVHVLDLSTLTVRADDFEGYEAWLDSLTFAQEPAPDDARARYVTPEEWGRIVASDVAAPRVPSFPPSARERRGRELAEAENVFRYSERLFVVEGTRGARYLVRRDDRRHSCDCPDFERWGRRPRFVCKHGWAAAIATAEGLVVNARGAAPRRAPVA